MVVMATELIEQLIDKIRVLQIGPSSVASGIQILMELRCVVLPRLTWQDQLLEDGLNITLPQDIRTLWQHTSGLILFEDITYGQWGLVIWSPDQTMIRHQRHAAERPGIFQPSDLIIGEFLGDSELLMIRCDPTALDFGSVHIALPLDARQQWYRAAPSLTDFVRLYLSSNGEKYWE